MKRLFLSVIFSLGLLQLTAQSIELARQYYEDGEYEKAASLYRSLWNKNKANETYLNALTDCYLALRDFDTAAGIMSDAITQNPKQPTLRISYASLLLKLNKNEEAEKQMNYVIDNLQPNPNSILMASRAFDRIGRPEMAIRTLEKGQTLIDAGNIFSYDLGQLYFKTGQQDKMLAVFVDQLIAEPAVFNSLTTTVQRNFREPKEYDEFLKVVFRKVQENPQNPQLIELLSWIYIQKKDFPNAMRQLKALDIQTGNNFPKVYTLAMTAYNEGQYDVAISGFEYILEKGRGNYYFFDAGRYRLKALVEKNVINTEIPEAEQALIDKEYSDFITSYSETGRTVYMIYDYAEFLMKYRKDLDKAIAVLQDAVDKRMSTPPVMAELKIRLADYLLIKGERWDASLLYSQVDKDFKEEPLGQEARYKNARLSYFVGDFEWAQAQFDALKTATTRMISNDAIDQSVFILDNMGMDSTDAAMKIYAATELLIYRNLLDEALVKLDTLLKTYPNHSLDDDVLYAQAHIFVKQKNYPKAIACYEKVFTDYKDEIRADNAMYELAQLYDYTLHEESKARDLYERLFNEYSGSVYAYDARQRYRTLRGDVNQ